MRLVMFSRLNEYVDELNRRNGYIIKTSQLAEAVKIRRATLIEWLNPERELSRVEADTLEKLTKYFALENDPGALVRYAWVEDEAEAEKISPSHYERGAIALVR